MPDRESVTSDRTAREMPYTRNAVLLGGFVILFVVAIFTVLVPELEDAAEEPTPEAAEGQAAASPGDL